MPPGRCPPRRGEEGECHWRLCGEPQITRLDVRWWAPGTLQALFAEESAREAEAVPFPTSRPGGG